MSAPVQYGVNIQAQATYFQNQQLIPEDRVQKIFQTLYGLKISGGFRTFEGAVRFARIRGFISTARKQNWDIMNAIRQAMMGYPPIAA